MVRHSQLHTVLSDQHVVIESLKWNEYKRKGKKEEEKKERDSRRLSDR